MAKEQSCNNGIGVLAAAIDASDTTLTLGAIDFPPLAAPFNIRIEDEILRVVARDQLTNTYEVDRGAEGTTPAPHAMNLNVFHPLTLAGLKRWNEQLLDGTPVAHQRGLNFIPSGNVTIALAEDAINENCDVTIGTENRVLASSWTSYTLLSTEQTGISLDIDLSAHDLRGRLIPQITPIVRVAVEQDGHFGGTSRGDRWAITSVWFWRADGTLSVPQFLTVDAYKVAGTHAIDDQVWLYYTLLSNF